MFESRLAGSSHRECFAVARTADAEM